MEEDVTALAPRLLQRGADQGRDSATEESENGEVLVCEGEELEAVGESAFGKLMASAVEQSKYVWFPMCLVTVPKLTAICRFRKQYSFEVPARPCPSRAPSAKTPTGASQPWASRQPKWIKRVLKERGPWPDRGLVLERPTTHNRRAAILKGAVVLTEFLRQRALWFDELVGNVSIFVSYTQKTSDFHQVAPAKCVFDT